MEAEAQPEVEAVFSFFQEAEAEVEVEAKRHCFQITAFELLDGFSNFKKLKWSELNFECIELLPGNQAATKAAVTVATSV